VKENFAPMLVEWSSKNETSSCSNKGNVSVCVYVPDDVKEIIKLFEDKEKRKDGNLDSLEEVTKG